jgi:hypothetical protein
MNARANIVSLLGVGAGLILLGSERAAGAGRDALLADPELSLAISYDETTQADVCLRAMAPVLTGSESFVPGMVGQALSFEGAGSCYISYPLGSDLDLKNGTIMLWFRPAWDGRDPEGQYTILWITMRESEKYLALHRSFNPQDKKALYANLHWDNVLQVSTEEAFRAGEWLHIAMTWDAGRNEYVLYFNAREVAKGPWKDLSAEKDCVPADLVLGEYYHGEGGDSPINASYDDIFVLKRALSREEIQGYHQQASGS